MLQRSLESQSLLLLDNNYLHSLITSKRKAGRPLFNLQAAVKPLQAEHRVSGGDNMTRFSGCTLQAALKLKFLGVTIQSQTLYMLLNVAVADPTHTTSLEL